MQEQSSNIGLAIGPGNEIRGADCAASRETLQSVVQRHLRRHVEQACAWRWLNGCIAAYPPSPDEEAALWELLRRADSNRF